MAQKIKKREVVNAVNAVNASGNVLVVDDDHLQGPKVNE
jgi:hypothetical protein